MSKLPPTPLKPPPAASVINPSSSSLPPRPPPSQVSFRKSTPIVPAVPMGLLVQKKQFPPQGIGRGHSSLPPKPAFPGKPLPRDTDAVVLTPGDGEGPMFNQSFKQKRTYSSVASESTMRPMDPAVTNLTPGNTISPSAHAIPQHNNSSNGSNGSNVPQTITPPAETSSGKNQPQMRAEPEGNSSGRGPKQRNPNQQINGFVDPPIGPRRHMEPQQSFRPEQQHPSQAVHDHPQNNGNHGMNNANMNSSNNYQSNNLPQPDMYHVGPQFGMHPAPPPPHPHQPGFFPQHPYHAGTLTPPNSGSMFMPPPMPPHIDNIMYSGEMMANGLDGNNMNQHRPFSPPYGFQVQQLEQGGPRAPPGLQNFQPPVPPMPSHGPPRSHPQHDVPRNNQERAPAVPEKINGAAPVLPDISFVAPEEGEKPGSMKENKNEAAFKAANQIDLAINLHNNHDHVAKLDNYTQFHFLSSRLSDVSLVLNNPSTRATETLPVHSFILGRSEKLCRLIESTFRMDSTSWADDFEDYQEPIKAMYSPQSRMITITINSSVHREPFILALRTMYGVPDWTLDAYLDPGHPSNQPLVAELERTSLSEGVSLQVEMFERSISLLAVGAVLGLDDVMHKAMDGISRWGMMFEGCGFERLMKFLLEDVQEMKKDKSLASIPWDFTKAFLQNAISRLAQSLGAGFKIDFRAPSSKYLLRLGNQTSPTTSGRTTPLNGNGQAIQPKSMRQNYSTILLSLPFEILKGVLEHESLALDGKKQRFDLATSVIQERERRRRREIKSLQELNDKKLDEDKKSESTVLVEVRSDSESEILFWEESVVSTFGHGGIGIEVTKRRKGGPGGRMLWKIGRRGSSTVN